MPSLYDVMKFLHVTGAIVWVGGIATLAVMTGRMAGDADRAALKLMARQSEFLGRAVMGPSAGLTLLTGLGLSWILGGFTFWMVWGLTGVVASMVLGATLLRRANLEMEELVDAGTLGGARFATVRRRLAVTGALNLALLLSVVWAMVAKPAP